MNLKKGILFAFGWFFVVLGTIGIVTPVLPTTPFMLLAAICFSKSSDRCHRWLLSQPMIGPTINDWNKHGVIPLRAKALASVMIVIGYAFLFWRVKMGVAFQIVLVLLPIGVLAFIWTRPSLPR